MFDYGESMAPDLSLGVQRSFDDLGTPLIDVTFCVVDLETTGGSARDSDITEIGAVRVRGGEVLGTFQTLVDPGGPIPPFITVLTGITHAMVVEAPPIDAALPAFLEFCGTDSVVVGHNVRFDLSFLAAACRRLGYPPLPNRTLDTAALARRLIRSEVRSLKLSSLAAHLRSPVAPTHRALDDARATVHVLHGLLERAGSIGVTALEDLLVLPTARGTPDYRKIHLAKALPRAPGVYLFRDRHGEVIYVGKAKNLRTRVMSYFHGDQRRSIGDMLRQLRDIEHRTCTGELEAAVTELRLIHAHRPRFNRASRPSKATHWVTLTRGPFPRLSLTRTLHDDAPLVLGPFRSRRSAELVATAIWDATLIRRCTGRPGSRSGPCAPAQLGQALCPCDGTLTADRYADEVRALVAAIDRDPEPLLAALRARMLEHARRDRFEEAGWVRDRHRALARAIERRRRWQSLVVAGRVVLERADGEVVCLDRGRFVATWRSGETPPLIAQPMTMTAAVTELGGDDERAETPVPPTLAAAAELDMTWRWLEEQPTTVLAVDGDLAMPRAPIRHLTVGGLAATA